MYGARRWPQRASITKERRALGMGARRERERERAEREPKPRILGNQDVDLLLDGVLGDLVV